jgi:2-amino-4-hydroxy-6-hydroxymethyldihydropteridine diphosphokinase
MKPDFQKFAFVALGSNLTKRPWETISYAMTHVQFIASGPVWKSSVRETKPVDCPPGSPNFYNAIVGFLPQKKETPESLLKKMQELEKEFGRVTKKVLNEPRPLDLDLIAFGNKTRNTLELILPHPRAHLRRFVLQPLSEIAPELILPGQTKTVLQLLAELPADETMRRV